MPFVKLSANLQDAVAAMAVAAGDDGTDYWLVAFSHHRKRGDTLLEVHDLATWEDCAGTVPETPRAMNYACSGKTLCKSTRVNDVTFGCRPQC
jgi:hypothetical protein